MTFRPRTALILVVTLLACLAPIGGPATAEPGDGGWSVLPASHAGQPLRNAFEYRLKPGEQVTDHVTINNLGTTPLSVAVYATDAFNGPDGAFALLTAAQEPRDIGTWVTLERRDHTVPPRTRLDIPFKLRVPDNAAPGDHSGGIVASITTPQTTPEGQTVTVERRVGTRLHTRVNGPVRAVARISKVDVRYDNPLNPFGGGGMTITYHVVNEGNVRLKGSALVSVDGPFGTGLADTGRLDVPDLLPDTEVRFTRRVENVFPAFRLHTTVRVNAASAEGPIELLTAERSVWAMPWLLLILLAALLTIVLGYRFRHRVRRLRLPRRPSQATAVVALALVAAAVVLSSPAPAVADVLRAPAEPSDTVGNDLRVSVAPGTTSQPPSATPTPTATEDPPPTGALPRTGYAVGTVIVAGAVLVAGGAVLRALTRRT